MRDELHTTVIPGLPRFFCFDGSRAGGASLLVWPELADFAEWLILVLVALSIFPLLLVNLHPRLALVLPIRLCLCLTRRGSSSGRSSGRGMIGRNGQKQRFGPFNHLSWTWSRLDDTGARTAFFASGIFTPWTTTGARRGYCTDESPKLGFIEFEACGRARE